MQIWAALRTAKRLQLAPQAPARAAAARLLQVHRPLRRAMRIIAAPPPNFQPSSKGLLDPPYASTERGGYSLLERELGGHDPLIVTS
jgi:hypothetical protein